MVSAWEHATEKIRDESRSDNAWREYIRIGQDPTVEPDEDDDEFEEEA